MINSYEDAVACAEEVLRETHRTAVPDSLKAFTDRCAAGEVPVSGTNLATVLRLAWLLYQMGLHTSSHSLVQRLVTDPPPGYPPGGDPNRCAVLLTCLGHPNEAHRLLTSRQATQVDATMTEEEPGGASAADGTADGSAPVAGSTNRNVSDRQDWAAVRAAANLAAISVGTEQPQQAARWLAQADLLVAEAVGTPPVEVSQLLAGVKVLLARRQAPGPVGQGAMAEFGSASLAAIEALDPRDPQGYLIVAQLALAVIENARDARANARLEQAANVLEAASQRLSAMLGADHPRALVVQGKLAAVHVECARAARSPLRLVKATTHLAFICKRLNRHVGARHPQALAAVGNLAVARLECARVDYDRTRTADVLQDLHLQWQNVTALVGKDHPVAHLVQASYQVCQRLAEKIGKDRQTASPRPAARYERTTPADSARPSDFAPPPAAAPRHLLTASGAAVQLRPSSALSPQVSVNDIGNEEAFLAAIDETIKYFNDGDIVDGVI
ncbi:hypothetical protein ACFYNL_34900, partial [Streptomyces sp. NPDC007808]|uniref:hypothetical protein n=1 Tax=Streptomyces sp. NPDC007808 TaxID=3364779 RepID=UPI00368C7CB6